MTPTDQELLQEIVRGAHLTFENAEKLYSEAQLLGRSGAFARALTLHQISMEECSKVDMLGTAAVSLVLGHPLDLNRLVAPFRQHMIKNYNNAYMSVTTEAEREARKGGDFEHSIAIFKAQQATIHHWLNSHKNASLYVDYQDGKFISPSEQCTEELAVQFQALNGFFLRHGANHLALLNRIATDLDVVAAQAKDVLGRLEDLKATGQNEDLEAKFQEIVDSWMDEQIGKMREGRSKDPNE